MIERKKIVSDSSRILDPFLSFDLTLKISSKEKKAFSSAKTKAKNKATETRGFQDLQELGRSPEKDRNATKWKVSEKRNGEARHQTNLHRATPSKSATVRTLQSLIRRQSIAGTGARVSIKSSESGWLYRSPSCFPYPPVRSIVSDALRGTLFLWEIALPSASPLLRRQYVRRCRSMRSLHRDRSRQRSHGTVCTYARFRSRKRLPSNSIGHSSCTGCPIIRVLTFESVVLNTVYRIRYGTVEIPFHWFGYSSVKIGYTG